MISTRKHFSKYAYLFSWVRCTYFRRSAYINLCLRIPICKLQLKSVQTTAEVCADYTCSLYRLRRGFDFRKRTLCSGQAHQNNKVYWLDRRRWALKGRYSCIAQGASPGSINEIHLLSPKGAAQPQRKANTSSVSAAPTELLFLSMFTQGFISGFALITPWALQGCRAYGTHNASEFWWGCPGQASVQEKRDFVII